VYNAFQAQAIQRSTMAMLNTNWRDLYDERTGTCVRASPTVLQHLGREGVLQIALHLKARQPRANLPGAERATGYFYRAGGLRLVATVFLLEQGQLPVILISTQQEWAEYHRGQAEWDWN
jgi:hypothetical protein